MTNEQQRRTGLGSPPKRRTPPAAEPPAAEPAATASDDTEDLPRRERGSVTLLKNGRYWARVTDDQGRRMSIGTYATHDDADLAVERYYRERRVRQPSSRAFVPTSPSVLQVYDEWCAVMESKDKRSANSTRRRANFRAGYLLASTKAAIAAGRTALGQFAIDALDYDTCLRWAKKQHDEEGLRPVTVVNNWRLLSRAFAYARKQHYIAVNPIAGEFPLEWGDLSDSQRLPFLLTVPEMVRLTQTFSPRYGLMAEVLIWSGMRQSEVRALRWNDLDDNALLVDEALEAENPNEPVFGRTKTRRSVRAVPVPHSVLAALRRQQRRSAEPMFTVVKPRKPRVDAHGNPAVRLITEGGLGDLFRQARARAGLQPDVNHPHPGRRDQFPSPHDCRRTVVTLLYEIGATEPEVQAWVGHAAGSRVTVDDYATIRPAYRTDPVIREVRTRTDLDLPERWSLLYERAWECYGEALPAEFPPASFEALEAETGT